jgi:putative transposase
MTTDDPNQLRQSPRLRSFGYTGNYAYHFGSKTRGSLLLFRDEEAAKRTLDALEKACQHYAFKCLAYCLMPNHVHVLAQSESGKSAEEFMRYFKQLSGYAYKKRTGQHLWQVSYFDHVLRSEEAIRPIAEYIWANPVRAGLVTGREDYPYSGPVENMSP